MYLFRGIGTPILSIYFTVDRMGSASLGASFQLIQDYSSHSFWRAPSTPKDDELIARIDQMYPEGLSRHGIRYLIESKVASPPYEQNSPNYLVESSTMIEAIFELVRRAEFSHLPSRMQSMFAWCNLNAAHHFGEISGGGKPIYTVDSERAFIGDINLLYGGGSVIASYELARQYWSGAKGNHYKPEAVIPLPIVLENLI